MKVFLYLPLLLSISIVCCSPGKRIQSSKQAIFSFIFDDLNTTDADVKAIFDEFKFKPSFAIQSNKLHAETAPLYQTYSKEGISILSHSHTHMRMQDPSKTADQEVRSELLNSKAIIEGYGLPVSGFVTPYSKMHPEFLNLLDSIYAYAFTTNNHDLFDNSVNKLHLSRYGIEGNISSVDHNIKNIKRRIDLAIEKKELVVFYGHALPSTYLDESGQSRVNADDLRAILSYIKNKADRKQCLVLPSDMAIIAYYK